MQKRLLALWKIFFFLFLFFSCSTFLQAQTIYYVSTTGNDVYDGTSWVTPFRTVQKALATATLAGTQIWVAKGTYYPDEVDGTNTNDRMASFAMKNGVALYGGFSGSETQLSQRNWKTYRTTLSGDIDQNDIANFTNNAGNSYHVVIASGINNSGVLDGFTITAANANGASGESNGGGVNVQASSLYISNCTFRANNAANAGGGVFNYGSATYTNCSFLGNTAGGGGGGVYTASATVPTFFNCIFLGNKSNWGGGMANDNAPQIINCTFSGNYGNSGGALHNWGPAPVITNSVFWGDNTEISNATASVPTISYSLIQGQNPPGTGNLDGTNAANNPLFAQQPDYNSAPTASGNLRLLSCSPLLNKDNNAANSTSVDLDNKPRKVNTIDLGAYEYQGTTPVIYVNSSATGDNNGTSWTDAYNKLQDAIATAGTSLNSCPAAGVQIWVAKGTYYPDEGGGNTNNDRLASFVMKNGLSIYGGFAGIETVLTQRYWKTNVTIISGDIDQNDGANFTNNAGNSYHVVIASGVNSSSILDGFTIIAANGNGAGMESNGGGANIQNSSLAISNCTFRENSVSNAGGGIYSANSSPTITNCHIIGNNSASGGGGIYNDHTLPASKFINCVFSGNKATNAGGALTNDNSSPGIINCSFSGNYAPIGGAIDDWASNPVITNSVFWGNSSEIVDRSGSAPIFTYSLVKGLALTGNGNLDGTNSGNDPLFMQQPDFNSAPTTAGNLTLFPCSPISDKGNSSANNTTTDASGSTRKVNSIIDLGGFEFESGTIYVDKSATGANNGRSWANAYTKLQDALQRANGCGGNIIIKIAPGTYYPDEGAGITDNDRNATFAVKKGITLSGGGAGYTILSGDIDQDGGIANNSYHVVTTSCNAVLELLTIAGGNADSPTSPNNVGGGVYNIGMPTIRLCSFTSNYAARYGGAIYSIGGSLCGANPLTASSTKITNCAFINNRATNGSAIGASHYGTKLGVVAINCSFKEPGGTFYNAGSTASGYAPVVLTNCISWSGGGELNNYTYFTISNSLIFGYGKALIGSSNIETGTDYYKNSPFDLTTLELLYGSPAINSGDDNAGSDLMDLKGLGRRNGTVDLGAFEYYKPVSTMPGTKSASPPQKP